MATIEQYDDYISGIVSARTRLPPRDWEANEILGNLSAQLASSPDLRARVVFEIFRREGHCLSKRLPSDLRMLGILVDTWLRTEDEALEKEILVHLFRRPDRKDLVECMRDAMSGKNREIIPKLFRFINVHSIAEPSAENESSSLLKLVAHACIRTMTENEIRVLYQDQPF